MVNTKCDDIAYSDNLGLEGTGKNISANGITDHMEIFQFINSEILNHCLFTLK